jgi:hypothetical protein
VVQQTGVRTPADLEYRFAKLVVEYVKLRGLSHQTIVEVRGTLRGAVAEFERRLAFDYEDKAIQRNGDGLYDQFGR